MTGSIDTKVNRKNWLCIDCCEFIPLADDEECCTKCGVMIRTIGNPGITMDFSALFREERAAARAEERRQRQLALADKRGAGSVTPSAAPRPRTSRTRRSTPKSAPADDEGDAAEVAGGASAAPVGSAANEPKRHRSRRVCRVTLIGRELDPDRWDDLLAECLEALSGGKGSSGDGM